MGEHYNAVLHSTEELAKDILESSLDSQIMCYYFKQKEFAVVDQAIFTRPLDSILESKHRAKRLWLILPDKYYSTTRARKMGNQSKMITFFQKRELCAKLNPNDRTNKAKAKGEGAYGCVLQRITMMDILVFLPLTHGC